MRKGLMWLVLLSVGVSAQSIPEQTGYWVGTLGALLFRLGGSLEDIGADPVKFVIAVKIALLFIGWFIIYPSRFPTPLKYSALALLLFTLVSVQAQFILTATGILRILVQSGFLVLAIIASYRAVKFVRGRSRPVQIGVLGGLLFMLYQLYSLWAPKLSGTVAMAYWLALVVGAIGLAILLFFAVSKFLPASIAGPASSVERDIITRLRKRTLRKNIEKKAKKSLEDAAKAAASDASSAAQGVQQAANGAAAELTELSKEVKESEQFIEKVDELLKGDAKDAFAFFIENYARMNAKDKIMMVQKGEEFVKTVDFLKNLAAAEEERVFGLFSDVKNGIIHFESFAAELAGYISTIEENELACAKLELEVLGLPFSGEERAKLLALLLSVKAELGNHKSELQREQKELDELMRSLADVRAERKKISGAYRELSGIPVRVTEMKHWFDLIFDKARTLDDISPIMAPMRVDFELMVKFVSQMQEFKKVIDESVKFFSGKISTLMKLTTSTENSVSAALLERVAGPMAQIASRCDAVRQYVEFKKKEASFERLAGESMKRIDVSIGTLQKRANSVVSSNAQAMQVVFVSVEQAPLLLASLNSLIEFYDFSARQLAYIESEGKKARDFLGKILGFKQSLKEDMSQTQAQISQLDEHERKLKERLSHLLTEAPEAKRHAELLKSLVSQLMSQDQVVQQTAQQRFAAEGQQLAQFVKASLAEISRIASQPF